MAPRGEHVVFQASQGKKEEEEEETDCFLIPSAAAAHTARGPA